MQEYGRRNAARFARWDPPLAEALAMPREWIALVRGRRYTGASFLAFDRAAPTSYPIAIVGLSSFGFEPPSALLDYSVDGTYEGRGYATEAVRGVLDYARRELGRTTFEATYDPQNLRSGALLARLGFRVVAQTPGLAGLIHAQVLAVLDGDPHVG